MNLLHNSKAAVHKAASVAVKVAHKAARKRPLLWPVWQTLPVAGLDVSHTQAVLYNLRRALPEGEEVCLGVRLCVLTQPVCCIVCSRVCAGQRSGGISRLLCAMCC